MPETKLLHAAEPRFTSLLPEPIPASLLLPIGDLVTWKSGLSSSPLARLSRALHRGKSVLP